MGKGFYPERTGNADKVSSVQLGNGVMKPLSYNTFFPVPFA